MASNLKSLTERVCARIESTLDGHLLDTKAAKATVAARRAALSGDAVLLDEVLAVPKLSYRDAMIIQLAFGLEDAGAAVDHTKRAQGARGVAEKVGAMLASRHIAGVRDAYQNIGKNIEKLDRGNIPAFDNALHWMNSAKRDKREVAFDYVLAQVSLTARPVLPMPDIKRASLTFHKCAVFVDALLRIPSGGGYQQFAVVACLQAVIDEFGQGGPCGLRVETKNLNASDKSSKISGDVQIIRGNRVEEVFEVTANDWRTKVGQATDAVHSEDLQRAHIVAVVEETFPAGAAELDATGVDLSVIDVSAYLRTLIAVMRKPAREAALIRLYELLDRHQPDIERTNSYVKLLQQHGLSAP